MSSGSASSWPGSSARARAQEYFVHWTQSRGPLFGGHALHRSPLCSHHVALKIIDSSRREIALKEAEIARDLKHPNVVPILELSVSTVFRHGSLSLFSIETVAGSIILVEPYACRGDLYSLLDDQDAPGRMSTIPDCDLLKYIGDMVWPAAHVIRKR